MCVAHPSLVLTNPVSISVECLSLLFTWWSHQHSHHQPNSITNRKWTFFLFLLEFFIGSQQQRWNSYLDDAWHRVCHSVPGVVVVRRQQCNPAVHAYHSQYMNKYMYAFSWLIYMTNWGSLFKQLVRSSSSFVICRVVLFASICIWGDICPRWPGWWNGMEYFAEVFFIYSALVGAPWLGPIEDEKRETFCWARPNLRDLLAETAESSW